LGSAGVGSGSELIFNTPKRRKKKEEKKKEVKKEEEPTRRLSPTNVAHPQDSAMVTEAPSQLLDQNIPPDPVLTGRQCSETNTHRERLESETSKNRDKERQREREKEYSRGSSGSKKYNK
jgi:hypothetical protein